MAYIAYDAPSEPFISKRCASVVQDDNFTWRDDGRRRKGLFRMAGKLAAKAAFYR